MGFHVTEELVHYDPDLRASWRDGGTWPHAHLYHFHEAVVAAHFILRGYHVLRDYSSTGVTASRVAAEHSTALMHAVVGPQVSEFFRTELGELTDHGTGQPDLFVFYEDLPGDPKVRYPDAVRWFFVEVKGPGDTVRPGQRRFWRVLAERADLGLGPERIRLFKTAPVGDVPPLNTLEY